MATVPETEERDRRDAGDPQARENDRDQDQDRPDDRTRRDADAAEELERTRVALAKANKEAEANRKGAREAKELREKLDEIEREKQKRADQELPEIDRLKVDARDKERRAAEAERRAEDAEKELARLRVDVQITDAARGRFIYPEDVPKLIDRSRLEVDEETGRVTNLDKLLDRLLKDREGLAVARPGQGTPPRDNPRRPVGPAPTADQPSAHEQLAQRINYPNF